MKSGMCDKNDNNNNNINNNYYYKAYRNEKYKIDNFDKSGKVAKFEKVRKVVLFDAQNSYFEGIESNGGCHELR